MTKLIRGGVFPVVSLGLVCILTVPQAARAFEGLALLGLEEILDFDRNAGKPSETAEAVASRESKGARARVGRAILFGIVGPLHKAPTPLPLRPKSLDLASTGTLRDVPQPTLALRIFRGSRPGNAASARTLFVLNASSTTATAGGQTTNGPVHVDFIDADDLSYDARVDIEAGLGSNASFEPWDMAMTRDGTLLVVAARGSDTLSDPRTPIPPHLTLIDTASAQVLRHVNLPAQFLLHSLALAPDGSFAFVAASELGQSQSGVPPAVANTILVVDLRSNAVVERIDLPPPAASAMGETVITPDGALLFVKGPAGISVIDTRTRTITATISGFPTAARHLAMDPHGTKVYVADVFATAIPGDPSQFGIAVIDVATATRTEVIRVPKAQGGSRQDLVASFSGRVLSHIDSLSGTWTIFDATTYDVVTQVDLGGSVFRGAIAE